MQHIYLHPVKNDILAKHIKGVSNGLCNFLKKRETMRHFQCIESTSTTISLAKWPGKTLSLRQSLIPQGLYPAQTKYITPALFTTQSMRQNAVSVFLAISPIESIFPNYTRLAHYLPWWQIAISTNLSISSLFAILYYRILRSFLAPFLKDFWGLMK
jgi:hypothetical protein